MGRVFVATYDSEANFSTTLRESVIGAANTYRNFAPRFRQLRAGDLILVRDHRSIERLQFFGHCLVTGSPFRQGEDASPFDDLLWPDERAREEIRYPWRIAVDFDDTPDLAGLYTRDWDDWLALGWTGDRGKAIQTKQQLALLFRGNFIPPRRSAAADGVRALHKLLTNRGRHPDRGNTDRIGKAGERIVLEHLKAEFGQLAVEFVWQRQCNPYAPYDIEVVLPDRTIYVEVKATTKSIDPAWAYISSRELTFRAMHQADHRLYLVVFDGAIDDPDPSLHLLKDSDFEKVPVKYRLDIPLAAHTIVRGADA